MANTTSTKSVLKLVATTSSKIRDLVIENGQLVFLYDIGRIAFDYKGKRVFYNQIVELESDAERLALEAPLDGYYFVISSACLWRYRNEWIQITDKPEDIMFIGDEESFPELGKENKFYINSTEGNEYISIWDKNDGYKIVSDKTQSVTSEEVIALFN